MKRSYPLRMRLCAAIVPLWLVCCAGDDTDPDSDACKEIRAQYLKAKTLRDEAVRLSPGISTALVDVKLAELVNEHWACFH